MVEIKVNGQITVTLPDDALLVVQKAEHYWLGFYTGLILAVVGIAGGAIIFLLTEGYI